MPETPSRLTESKLDPLQEPHTKTERVAFMQRTMAAVVARNEDVVAVLVALLAQHCDPTHVDVARAAQLRGCSVKTIRRAIAAGELTLGIPLLRVPGIISRVR